MENSKKNSPTETESLFDDEDCISLRRPFVFLGRESTDEIVCPICSLCSIQSDNTMKCVKKEEMLRLGDSIRDPEEKRNFLAFTSIIEEIGNQNQLMEDMNVRITDLCAKSCRSDNEVDDIKQMRAAMQTEHEKLMWLINQATKLQQSCKCRTEARASNAAAVAASIVTNASLNADRPRK